MPTRLTTFVLGAVTLLGCATVPRVDGLGPAPEPPLRVWIGYPIGSSRVYPIFTNREAHVAMFEIIPGRGATLVYPRTQFETGLSASHYADLTVVPGRMFYHTDPFGYASFAPRYYYAVASIAPLNLASLRSSLGATRRVLGRMYSSYRPYDVIDQLTSYIVPMQSDDDWATDLFVHWPEPRMPRFANSEVLADNQRVIACANGHVIRVPSSYPYHGCPGDAENAAIAVAEPKEPSKQLPVEAPRGPRAGGGREGIELSDGIINKRRRAEPGARVPERDVTARSPSDRTRYSDQRASGRSPKVSARGSSSAGSSDPGRTSLDRSSGGRERTPERAEPASRPSSERSGSEKQKKP